MEVLGPRSNGARRLDTLKQFDVLPIDFNKAAAALTAVSSALKSIKEGLKDVNSQKVIDDINEVYGFFYGAGRHSNPCASEDLGSKLTGTVVAGPWAWIRNPSRSVSTISR